MKYIFATLTSPDQVIYGTTCQIVSQLLRYCK